MEKWDAYLKDGSKANQQLERGQTIPDGLYHLVVEVLVQHTDGSFLFVKRHQNKPSYPNYFEISAGGSALLGETAEQGAYRELLEETGILANNLLPIEQYFDDEDACYFRAFYTLFSGDKTSVHLQTEETIDYVWVPRSEVENFVASQPIVPWQKARLLRWLQDH